MFYIWNRADMVGKPVTKSRQDSQEGSVGCLRLIFRDVTQYTELVGPTFEEGLYVLILSLLRTDVTTKVLVAVCGYMRTSVPAKISSIVAGP